MTEIKPIELQKAIKKVLQINYKYMILDLVIKPDRIEWYTAVRFRRDKEKNWHPRILVYFKKSRKVVILNRLKDKEPTWVDAATILAMAELKAVSPPSGGNI